MFELEPCVCVTWLETSVTMQCWLYDSNPNHYLSVTSCLVGACAFSQLLRGGCLDIPYCLRDNLLRDVIPSQDAQYRKQSHDSCLPLAVPDGLALELVLGQILFDHLAVELLCFASAPRSREAVNTLWLGNVDGISRSDEAFRQVVVS